MFSLIEVVGTILSEVRYKTVGAKGTQLAEFALAHKWVNPDSGEVFETRFYTTLFNGNATWAQENALATGDKVLVLGSELTGTAWKPGDQILSMLNLKGTHVTRVDPGSRDYLAGQFIGAVGADAEMNYNGQGRARTSFRLATSAGYYGTDGKWVDRSHWYNVTLFGRGEEEGQNARAERAALIAKGDKVLVTLQTVRANGYLNNRGDVACGVDVIASSVRVVARKVVGEAGGEEAAPVDDSIMALAAAAGLPGAPVVSPNGRSPLPNPADVEF